MLSQFINDWLDAEHEEFVSQVESEIQALLQGRVVGSAQQGAQKSH